MGTAIQLCSGLGGKFSHIPLGEYPGAAPSPWHVLELLQLLCYRFQVKPKHRVEQSQENHRKTKLKPLSFIHLKSASAETIPPRFYSPHFPCIRDPVIAAHVATEQRHLFAVWPIHVTKLWLMISKQKCHVAAARDLPY